MARTYGPLPNHGPLASHAISHEVLADRGQVAEAGDILIQRFKAVETACASGSWGIAQHLEIAPTTQVTTVRDKELEIAAKLERERHRLAEAVQRGQGGGSRGWRKPPG